MLQLINNSYSLMAGQCVEDSNLEVYASFKL